MSNKQKLKSTFFDVFKLEFPEKLTYGDGTWDSLNHMVLMTSIEESFEIILDPNDIVSCSSYEVIERILSQNYGVNFEE